MKNFSISDLTKSALLTAVMCILSPITVYIGAIPITGALLGVFLIGGILPPSQAFFAEITYILLGICGIPVFSGFQSGYGILLGTTGGYLMTYPIMAFVIALAVKLFKKVPFFALVTGIFISLLICYIFGTLWVVNLKSIQLLAALKLCVFPFVIIDLAKAAAAVIIIQALKKRVPKVG